MSNGNALLPYIDVHSIVRSDDLPALQQAAEMGLDLNGLYRGIMGGVRSGEAISPITLAINEGARTIFDWLLGQSVDVNRLDEHGRPPILAASRNINDNYYYEQLILAGVAPSEPHPDVRYAGIGRRSARVGVTGAALG